MTRTVLQRVFPLVLGLLLVSCAGPTFRADRSGARIDNSAASRTTWTDDTGTVTSDFQGTPPALMQIGGGSAAIAAPGPHRVLSISQEPGGGVSLTLADPADTNFKGLAVVLADGTEVRLAEFSSSASAVIAAYDAQVVAALEAQKLITTEQAQTLRAAIAAGQSVAEALAEIGAGVVLPVPKKRQSDQGASSPPVVVTPPSDYGPTAVNLTGMAGLIALVLWFAKNMNQQNYDLRKGDADRLNDALSIVRDTARIQQETIHDSRQLVRELIEAKRVST